MAPAQPALDTVHAVPSFPAITSPLSAFPIVMPPLSVQLPLPLSTPSTPSSKSRIENRSLSPTHPKLHAREPPVPPGLVKKRQMTLIAATESALAAQDAAHTRVRGASLSIVTGLIEGRGGEGSKDPKASARWKRNSVVGIEGVRTPSGAGEHLAKAKSNLSLKQ